MDKINNFLSHVYGSNQSLLYFYIALGALALFFIIMVLIILFSSENARNNKEIKKEKIEEEPKKDEIHIKKEKVDKKEKQPSKSLSETQVFNNILMNKEEKVQEDKSYKEEKTKDEPKKDVVTEDVYLEKDNELNIKEDKTEIVEKNAADETKALQDFTIEIPKVKPMDIDEYLANKENTKREEELAKVAKEVKEEKTVEVKKVELTDDEVKNRLAKLKAKKAENFEKKKDADLEDLMKAVGLEDTSNIEFEEKSRKL